MPSMAFQVYNVNMRTQEDKKSTQVANALNALNKHFCDDNAASWKAVIAATDCMTQPSQEVKHICTIA